MNTQKIITLGNQTTNFFFKTGDKTCVLVGEKVITFKTNDKIVKYSLDIVFNDVKFPHAHGKENNDVMLHQKYNRIREYETSTLKSEYDYLYKKDDNFKGNENEDIIEYGNHFKSYKSIHESVSA